MRRRRHVSRYRNVRTMGDMITTFVFAGMALRLSFGALTWEGGDLGRYGLWLTAFVSALGAVRFPLQSLVDNIQKHGLAQKLPISRKDNRRSPQ